MFSYNWPPKHMGSTQEKQISWIHFQIYKPKSIYVFNLYFLFLLIEDGQVYSWGFGPIGKGPRVTYSKSPTCIPSTLFGQNEITPDAKVRDIFFWCVAIHETLMS